MAAQTPAAQLASASPEAARLGLVIGDRHFLVDLAEAGEIVPLPDSISAVPLCRDWLLGLVNLRGTLFTVADLLAFQQKGRVEIGKESRLLAFGAKLNLNAALLVTRTLGLRSVASMTEIDEPAAQPWLGRLMADEEGIRWRELSLSRLALHEQFLDAGR